MFPANFGYVAARSVDEALELLAQHGEDAKLLAGGHSLIPAMKLRLASPRTLIDLGTVQGLRGVRVDGDALAIGALTVHADIAASDLVRQRIPALAAAAGVIGDVQVRNRGTIGGSCAHADPAADFPVVLTALNASFAVVSPSGKRTISVDDFFVDFYTTALGQNEILTEIRVPLPPSDAGTAYHKLANPASGYVVVSSGALVRRDGSGKSIDARVALGGLGGKPFRAAGTETALRGKSLTLESIVDASAKAAEGSDPDDDIYASADYKRHIATVLTQRALAQASGFKVETSHPQNQR
ncbi:MAG TPA: xanthine dehydrogenase family protein subunit M [Candidatus Binatia bacterium]|nr:xanthine dehydrogenase family protein subunit M [Candidatus Binatia bacterium]